MMPNYANRAWLCLPAIVLYCCDVSITLASQNPEFWAGAFDTVEEGNPLARVLLLLGPWTFVAAAVGWAALFSAVILFGRRSWAMVLSFGLTFSHALGTACWLPRHGIAGMVAAVLVPSFGREIAYVVVVEVTYWMRDRRGSRATGSDPVGWPLSAVFFLGRAR